LLKGIIRDLHAGKDFEELKQRLARLVRNVSPGEIATLESRLIAEGMPEEEIKRLCSVHAALFQESLAEQRKTATPPGHPVHTFRLENDAIRQVVGSIRQLLARAGAPGAPGQETPPPIKEDLKRELARLAEINRHYLRKEHQLFPLLEQRGVVGPPKVMWQVHDDIRALLKQVTRAVEEGDLAAARSQGEQLLTAIEEMIDKEENILFPMAQEKLTQADWARVRAGEEEIGYTLVSPGQEWQPEVKEAGAPGVREEGLTGAAIKLSTGSLTPEQVNLLLTHLPVDITFVDENDYVRYYSAGKHRIFTRSPGIIGRKVQNCHPPASVHVVEKIVAEFKDGSKDTAEFWLTMNGRFIHIRYFAVRDAQGRYRGVVEVTQDVTDIRALEGEKRLLDW
ncbi:MAG: uncharacterized protein PWQ18_447, partial [Clostridia bacterium]|nr:uncharacterized protein [Clostridia bacterium]